MFFVKSVTALLFAAVLVAMAYGIFWFTALKYTEHRLAADLTGQLGMAVSYDMPVWHPDLTQIAVTLPRFSTRVALEDGISVVASWPEVVLEGSFFNTDGSMDMLLPGNGKVAIWHNGVVIAVYDLAVSGARVAYLKGAYNITTFAGQVKSGDREVLGWKDGMLSWQGGAPGAGELTLHLKNMEGVAGTMDAVQLKAHVDHMADMGTANWALLMAPDKAHVKEWGKRLAASLKDGATLNVGQAVVRKGAWELGGFGELHVDEDGIPQGELTLQAVSATDLAALFGKAGIVVPTTAEEVMRYQQSMADLKAPDALPLVKLVLHQGIGILNTQRVGRVPSATTLVEKWL